MATGLLSDGERAFVQGDKDTSDPAGYEANTRYRVRQRMDRIEADLAILEETDQDDLVDEFYSRFERVKRLEREVERLRQQVDDR